VHSIEETSRRSISPAQARIDAGARTERRSQDRRRRRARPGWRQGAASQASAAAPKGDGYRHRRRYRERSPAHGRRAGRWLHGDVPISMPIASSPVSAVAFVTATSRDSERPRHERQGSSSAAKVGPNGEVRAPTCGRTTPLSGVAQCIAAVVNARRSARRAAAVPRADSRSPSAAGKVTARDPGSLRKERKPRSAKCANGAISLLVHLCDFLGLLGHSLTTTQLMQRRCSELRSLSFQLRFATLTR